MDHFAYKNGCLYAEDVALSDIARQVGTPCYVYSEATIQRHYRVFDDALDGLERTVCFALKANSNLSVVRTLADMGAGADVVSGGELRRALMAGIPAEKIIFSGVGKTDEELSSALDAGILQINVESERELELLDAIAVEKGVKARIGIRINPDIDAKTHEKISTGKKENKFGIEWTRAHEIYARARDMKGIEARAMAIHIGSQLTDLAPFRDAFVRTRDLIAMLRADGHEITHLDLGGGLGVPYEPRHADGAPIPSPQAYGEVVRACVGDLGCHLIFEPGRVLVANAGVFLTRIVRTKEGTTRNFAIVDGAMNDLIRPTLYNAYHEIVPVREPGGDAKMARYDVVGPICESGDLFGKDRLLPPPDDGDLLAIRTAGAYGAVQGSMYNTRALAPEVLVRGDQFALIRRRLTVDDILALETPAPWLA
ncbi:diaminopimelate decarboxylase [Varunaivibrio sulfuroxidans]|uniref:Diaminopimelate decarboxylase n=1 Tax=Varunaivibrio sulfuroxidans TaxID=1773489 RepID=A0A4R3JEJ6_9PROT|nr:diaminopimelate decarboxylase [Varunaivibrio sulfuroxidans]TCS63526.1 diaminopimelate decarboxylase [Varunaivibrio sulfuroxidans]WES30329.1 diaminopimelate decarboxylase [Varunaivibrio sulfuroxidans]